MITGYKLYMDDGYGGELSKVLETVSFSSQINEYLAINLTPSLQYRFQVEPFNFNYEAPGPKSDIVSIYSCDLPNMNIRPSKIATSSSTISINWNEPADNGGCSI